MYFANAIFMNAHFGFVIMESCVYYFLHSIRGGVRVCICLCVCVCVSTEDVGMPGSVSREWSAWYRHA